MYLPRGNKKLRIILTQLPFRFYSLELTRQKSNIPLAAGHLKATAAKEGLLKEADIRILDPLTADITSDSMFLKALVENKPDMVGFSLYLWNLNRSLYLISAIKRHLPETIIVVGGPEVTEGFNRLDSPGVDFSITGEGEIPFIQLVKHLLRAEPALASISGLAFRQGNSIISNPRFDTINDVNEIPSVYLSGSLDPRPYRRYWLETMRWCVHRCKYCSYGLRSMAKNPFYSLERIKDEFDFAKKQGIRFVDIHDSAFNLNPKFREICGIIRRVNKDNSLSLNMFLQAEIINEEDAQLLSGLNISSVEIGLQSANPGTLSRINRNIDTGKWLKGINLLRKRGIDITVDIMIGLPGDSLKSFLKTMEFIRKNKLDTCTICPTLSVGPGTAVYREAGELGVTRFQSQPPYFILGTDRMPFKDIRKAWNLSKFHLARKLPKRSIFSPYCDAHFPLLYTYCRAEYPAKSKEAPDGAVEGLPEGIPITKVIIDLKRGRPDTAHFRRLGNWLSDKIANNLTVWFKAERIYAECVESIAEFLTCLSMPNPYNIWNMIFETRVPLTANQEKRIRQAIHYLPNNLDYKSIYLRRDLKQREFYRVSAKLLYILPAYVDGNYPPKTALKTGENRKIFRSLYLDSAANPDKVIPHYGTKRGEGILVDFSPQTAPEKVMDTLSILKARTGGRSVIRFKNLIVQKIWHKFFDENAPSMIIDNDLILRTDMANKREFSYITHDKITLDMTEFALSFKGRIFK